MHHKVVIVLYMNLGMGTLKISSRKDHHLYLLLMLLKS